MRMDVPSEVPGNRTLPAELRTPQHIPRGNAWGWHRLHQNLAPVTGGGVSGLGVDTGAMIPVDQPIFLGPPTAAPLPAYTGGGMPTYVQGLISQGLIAPQLPPRPLGSPSDAHLQHTPWGYIWAKVVKTSGGPVITWMNRPSSTLTGLGSCIDPSAPDYNPADCMAPTDTSGGIYETPYPVVYNDGSSGAMTAAQWAALIASSSNALTRTLAVSQGGSVSASGNIYGSPQTATVAAGFPQNQLSVTGSGVAGALSSPMVLLLVGALVLMTMSGRR